MTAPFLLPRARATDANNVISPGAKLSFFDAGTTNPRTVYKDAALTQPQTIPVIADGSGTFPPIYLPNGAYKYQLTDQYGLMLATDDNISGPFDPSTVIISAARPLTPTRVLTGNYTIAAADAGTVFDCQTGANSFALQLPSAALMGAGKGFTVIKSQTANTVSTNTTAPDAFSGAVFGSSFQIAQAGLFANFISTGAGWLVLAVAIPAGSITSSQLSSSITGSFMQVGSVIAWDLPGALPAGYLEQNGQLVSRTTYPQLNTLYAAAGYPYGAGDGSTTFQMKDMGGRFRRGWNNGSGRDPDAAARTNSAGAIVGDVVQSFQSDAYASHTHANTLTDPSHTHTAPANRASVSDVGGGAYSGGGLTQGNAGSLTNPATTGISITNAASGTSTETRGKNAYTRYIVFADPNAAAGASGVFNTLLNGFGVPSNSLGNNGDFYVDLSSNKIWGPKAAASWVSTGTRLAIHTGANYLFNTGIADADPTSGQVAINAATAAAVTTVFLSDTDNDANAMAPWIASWAGEGNVSNRGRLRIVKHRVPTVWAEYKITGVVTDTGTYSKVQVAYVAGPGGFASGDTLAVQFTPAGASVSGGGSSISGSIIQTQQANYTAWGAVNVPMNEFDAPPTITTGTQILSANITPALSTSKIRVSVDIPIACSNQNILAAVFRNGANNAIAADDGATWLADRPVSLSMVIDDAPGVATQQTYSVRVGPAAAGTVYLNGTSATRLFGGVSQCKLVLEEIAA